jgi:hypothetical protein
MKSPSEQIRELEERAEQLQRERDAQIALSRAMLIDERVYAERRQEFLHLLAANATAPIAIVSGRKIIDVTPDMLRRPNWN